ncbi:MAG TPA: ABC transporter permease [Gemmatimonadales bacterium]|nr:ABC transporter permease [Gemmatimonadales bacterium]
MLIQNIRYAIRSLRRAPGFTLTVVLTLGLGIGANTAIFSVVRGVLLKPLPHREGDRLVYLRQSAQGAGGENVLFSVPEILDFRNSARSLKGIAEYSPMPFTLQEENEAVRVDAGLVTGNYFTIMGLSTILGRPFNDGDDGTGAAPVMVLTHEYWMKKFAGDSAVVGKTVRVNGQAVPIVGVLQPAPYFPGRIDVLLNMVNSEHHLSATMVTGRTHRMTEMIARLAPGATLAQARAEVGDITARAHADYPEAYDAASGYQVTVKPFHEVLGERARLTLFLLMGAAAFVLIIACANVANLTLMRGVRREHELVVRAALGAGAARLRRLLLAENLVLTILGGALGLLVAFGGVGMLISFAERYSPRASEIRVDGVVLAFTLTLALLVAVILSYAPKLAKDSALGTWLAGGGKRATGNLRRQRLQRGLVVAQIAVSVVLLTGAGLLTRTMLQLSEVDTGLEPENVLTMEVPPSSYGQDNAVTVARYEEMRNQISALPGVKDVAVGSVIPLRAAGFMLEVKAEGRAMAPNEPMPRAENRTASPEYFRTAGIPILKGKEFSSTDRAGSPLVVILNKTLADRLFPNQDPIGRRVAWTGEVLKFIPVSGDWRTVIGVVGDTKDGGLDAQPLPVMFQPFAQEVVFAGGLVIRAASDAATITPAATRVIRGIAPQDPIERVLTLDQIRDESVAPRRLNAVLVASFGILAVIIAAVGIAGVLAFSVSARTNEIGIRMSLGADSGRVQRMVLREGGVLLVIGLLLGVLGSVLAARLIQGLLYGVAPHDPATLAAVATLMATIGLAACWLPALRAARIDPGVAIRAQ